MLEDYTVHLTDVFAAVIKKLVPEIMGGYMSARGETTEKLIRTTQWQWRLQNF